MHWYWKSGIGRKKEWKNGSKNDEIFKEMKDEKRRKKSKVQKKWWGIDGNEKF